MSDRPKTPPPDASKTPNTFQEPPVVANTPAISTVKLLKAQSKTSAKKTPSQIEGSMMASKGARRGSFLDTPPVVLTAKAASTEAKEKHKERKASVKQTTHVLAVA